MRRNTFDRRFAASVRKSGRALSLNRLEDRLAPALGDFELDGNATTQATHDWDQVYNDAVLNPTQNASQSIAGAVTFLHDPVTSPTDSIFTAGKDIDELSSWHIGPGTPQQKADIADVFAAAHEVQVGGQTHTVVNFGADRINNNGNATMGFWFLQNPIRVNPNGSINGTHMVGDVLVVADFSSSVASFAAYRWVGPGGSTSALEQLALDPADSFAIANAADIPTGGWPFVDRVGSPPNTMAPGEFFEAGIDLTALGLPSHLSTFVAETRASTSLNSALSDFVIGRLTTFTADVAVTKSVDNPRPNVGDNVTFTVTVTNNGPNDAAGVVVNDLLPAGLALVSATPGQGTYNSATGVWAVGDVARFQSQTLLLVATVLGPAPLTNIATATANQDDPNRDNNAAVVGVIPQQADLHLVKTVNNPTPNVGDDVTFTVTLTNQGPDAATNVTVTDLLPAGLTFQRAAPSQGTYDPVTGAWAVGTLAGQGTARLTLVARVDSVVPAANTGTVTGVDQFDPDLSDNSATATVTPRSADLQVQKTVDNPTPDVGDVVAYTIRVTNLGPDTATNITLHDTLPAGVTLLSARPTRGTFRAARRDWVIPSLAVGASATMTVQVRVTSPAPAANTVTITGADQFDPNLGNNTASSGVTPLVADLALTKAVSDPAPNVGDTVTFTLTLTNRGPAPAAGVAVSDPLPAGLALVSATPSQGTYDPATGVWTFGTLDPQATATLALAARVAAPAPATNVAVASSATFDPDATNNTATAGLTPQQADLAVSKSVDGASPTVGSAVAFTVTLTNNGPSAATNVRVHDLLPAGLSLVSATPSQGTYAAATGAWTVGTVASGASATLALQATLLAAAPQTNVATVSASDQFDPDVDNNRAQVSVTAAHQTDLAVTKVATPRLGVVGSLITFTVTVTNLGQEVATNVLVTDRLPGGLAFVSAQTSQGVYRPATGQWNILALGPGVSATLRITARVRATGTLVNTARVTFPGIDSDPTNDAATAAVVGIRPAFSKRLLLASAR